MIKEFYATLKRIRDSLTLAQSQNIELTKTPDNSKAIYDFKEKRTQYMKDSLQTYYQTLKKLSKELIVTSLSEQNEKQSYELSVEMKFLEEQLLYPAKALPIITKIEKILLTIDIKESETQDFNIKNLPSTVKAEINADLHELEKTFNNACYRSCVILSGRILEVALHAKYYQCTGQDILEKSPGIGLGNLIGKLKEKEIFFDPGLTQQIHLINQARVFSVHKKQDPFIPTKDQAHAVILYTTDILKKLF